MTASVRRVCQLVNLKPDQVERYLELHAAVWPEVEARLADSNVRNYTIFRRGLTLIGYYEHVGDDYAADMAAIADDPRTQAWWELTAPCQDDPESGTPGGPWRNLSEVWHLDEQQGD